MPGLGFRRSFSSGGISGAYSSISIPLSGSEDGKKQLDLTEMTFEEIKGLKKSDPFMYYSIPEIRRCSYKADDPDGEANDFSTDQQQAAALVVASSSASESASASVLQDASDERAAESPPSERDCTELARRKSCPAGLLKNAELVRALQKRGSITRNRRLSTEGHHTVSMEDFLGDLVEFDTDSDDEEDEVEQLVGALRAGHLDSLREQDE